jgi:hypothetical protein
MTTMNRDQISQTAWKASNDISLRACTPEHHALSGRLYQLNNDCCETQHTLKSLRRRLAALLRDAAAI